MAISQFRWKADPVVCWITQRKTIFRYVISHLLVRTENWVGKCTTARCPSCAFFLNKQVKIFFIYQPKKFFRVSSIQRAVWIPGTLKLWKPAKGQCIGMFFSFPLTLFQPWADFSRWRACWRTRVGAVEGRTLFPQGSPLGSGRFSPYRDKVMLWHSWPSWPARRAPTCSQSRKAADVHPSTGCPQNTAMATHSKLSPATYEYPAQLRGLRYLLPSCAIAKGGPSASPNYPSHHVKHSSLNHQPRSVFNTALHKGRKGRGQRSRSPWWYFLLNIIVLIPCLSSSWIICASSGTWLQLLWNPVAKAELINCRLACCSIQPASHVWAISPAKFVCLLKIIDGFPPAYPSSLPATRKAHIARMLFGTRESNSRSWLLPVCCYRCHKGIG